MSVILEQLDIIFTAQVSFTLLSSSNPYSWLSKNAENLLFYSLKSEALVFLKGPQEMLQIYENIVRS